MTDRAEIFEVGPRDGLQNEKAKIPTAVMARCKVQLSGERERESHASPSS